MGMIACCLIPGTMSSWIEAALGPARGWRGGEPRSSQPQASHIHAYTQICPKIQQCLIHPLMTWPIFNEGIRYLYIPPYNLSECIKWNILVVYQYYTIYHLFGSYHFHPFILRAVLPPFGDLGTPYSPLVRTNFGDPDVIISEKITLLTNILI